MDMSHAVRLLVYLLPLILADAQDCTTGTSGILRLADGGSDYGRVEICLGGEWGTVCHDGWDYIDAIVACRQLGLDVAYASARTSASYGQGTGPIFIDGVSCTGTEYSLLSCDFGYHSGRIGYLSSCSHSEDAGVSCSSYIDCSNGDVRLVDGLISTEGRVEVCMDGRWSGICDSSWNYHDAFVVCRQLGYPATDAIAQMNAYFGPGVNPHISHFECYGNESQLLDCQFSENFCSVYDNAGVQCRGEVITVPQCIEGSLRLADGSDEHEGRVEICSNGLWGTICDGGLWDSRDATVVCSYIGYQNARVSVYQQYNSKFGAGTGPILFGGLTCDGSEHSIEDCSSSSPYPQLCHHINDVGVRCEGFGTSVHEQCTDGDVRLAGGENENEGRVELCIGNVWGSVCDDGWDANDGAVVCRQLGYQQANVSVSVYSNSHFGEGSGPYHLSSVGCSGNEENLLSCSNTLYHYCERDEDAGVRCDATPSCHDGEVRLFGGATQYEGRLDVCYSRQWAPVCTYLYDARLPQIVCRQLMGSDLATVSPNNYYFPHESGHPLLYNFICNESASQVSDCTFSVDYQYNYCHYTDDLAVLCYEVSNCSTGDVRLADGKHEMEGRVEVCLNGTWSAISVYSWSLVDSIVACRQLGFPSDWPVVLDSHFRRGSAPALASDFYCSGTENNLTDCSFFSIPDIQNYFYDYYHYYYYYYYYYYYSMDVAGVICQGNSSEGPECVSGDIRLVNGSREDEGRVELCYDGVWRTICDQDWSQEEVVVVCSQLGLPKLGAQLFTDATFGEGSVPVLGYITCTGRERSLEDCVVYEQRTNCHHGRDAGVKCQGALTDYTISVASDPVEGEVSIGSTLTLYCNVQPEAPQGAVYEWSTSVNGVSISTTDSSSPNATVSISFRHPSVGHYYCHVYDHGALSGVGSTAVKVMSLVYSLEDHHAHFSHATNITMTVDVNPTSKVFYNLRRLTWFHDGNEITSGDTLVISEDQMNLTIYGIMEDDKGFYEAKFTGLLVQPYSQSCEALVLDLLAHYPVFKAAVFHLTPTQELAETGDTQYIQYPADITFKEGGDIYYTDSDNITLVLQGNIPPSFEELVTTRWNHNGQTLATDRYILEPLQKPFLSLSQTMKIADANFLDAGEYTAALEIRSYSYLRQHLQCPDEYYQFVTNTLGISSVTLGEAVIRLKYGEEPTDAESGKGHDDDVAAIGGGVIGGLVIIIVIVAILITVMCVLARKRRQPSTPSSVAPPPKHVYSSSRTSEKLDHAHSGDKPKEQGYAQPGGPRRGTSSSGYISATGAIQMGLQELEDYEDMEYSQEAIYEDTDDI